MAVSDVGELWQQVARIDRRLVSLRKKVEALEQQMKQISERYSDLLETGKQESNE